MLSSDAQIQVIATARDGGDALKKVLELKPDVVTLDIEMPRMDGLATLAHIMARCPTPTLMLSAMDKREADIAILALEHGAIDFIPKPSGTISMDIAKVKDELLEKVRMASKIKVKRAALSLPKKSFVKPLYVCGARKKVVAIGASTGGPRALAGILPRLPSNLPAALLIAQHMPPTFTSSLAERLDRLSSIEVREAANGDEILPGKALLAPGDYHMVAEEGRVSLNKKPAMHGVRPSADALMASVADAYGSDAVGVILTGMGSDGAAGMRAIKERGGETIVEDESTCAVFGMPRAAIECGAANRVVPLHQIADEIMRML
jgi:two-component system chemotaxis response regulator CheB